ncbi:MAG: sodium:solute symporter [Phycisphaerales bacterium]
MHIKHGIDAVVVGLYLFVTFIFGVFASKILHSNTHKEEGYFLAGRKMPGWLNGISFAVTCMNANVGPTYCGLTVVVGLSICWYYLSTFTFSLLIAGMFFAVKWRSLGISTGPEFFTFRFGGKGAKLVRVWSSFSMVSLCLVPFMGMGMLGVHMIVGPIFGIENKLITLSLILPVLLIYVWISGYGGVVVNDFIQTGIILLASLTLLILVLVRFHGPAGLADSIAQTHGAASQDILSLLPVRGHRVFGPFMAIAFMLLYGLGAGGNISSEGQRIFSCKSPREASKVYVWTAVALFVMLLVMTLPTLGALVEHPEMYKATPSQREQIYGFMLQDYLPPGLLGLAMAAVVASVMATIGGHLNYCSQTIVNDIFRPIVGNISDRKAMWIGRISMVGLLVMAVTLLFFSKSLFGMMIVIAGLFSPAALLGWGQWLWWRVNIWSWLTACIGGPITFLILGFVLRLIPCWRMHLGGDESSIQQLEVLQVLIAIGITTMLWVIVTLLTKPEDINVLKTFYRRALPLGFWEPVKKKVLEEDGEVSGLSSRRVFFSGIVAVLTGVIWLDSAVLSLSSLFVANYLKASLLAVISVVDIFVFKRVFDWHMARSLSTEKQTAITTKDQITKAIVNDINL